MLLTRLNAFARDDLQCGSSLRYALLRRGLAAISVLACLLLEHWLHLPVAHAQADGRVLVVPLDSTVPDTQADIVRAFNLALAGSLQREAKTVTIAQTSIDDTLAIVGCSERSASCLSRVAEALEVDYIVFGNVTPSAQPDTFEVTIVVARREGGDPPSEDRFSVQAAVATEAVGAFAGAAPPSLLGPRASIPTPTPTPDPVEPPAPVAGDASAGEARGDLAFDLDRVEPSSWIITGTGGAVFSMGIVFWLLASSSQSDIDSLEVGNVADLERLVALEDRTQSRANIGNALVLIGTLTAAVGVVLAARQGLVRKQPARIDVAPMATETSVGITLTIDWP